VGFKSGDFFYSNHINTEENYKRLIALVNQIPKLSNFDVLDLAALWCITGFPYWFFVLMQSHVCACNMYFVSSFVISWHFRRIDYNALQSPYLFFLHIICTRATLKIQKFYCVLYAHKLLLHASWALRHFLKCLPNLPLREQPLLLALDVFSMGCVI